MGVAVGDYDLDGRLDIFKTNFSGDNCQLIAIWARRMKKPAVGRAWRWRIDSYPGAPELWTWTTMDCRIYSSSPVTPSRKSKSDIQPFQPARIFAFISYLEPVALENFLNRMGSALMNSQLIVFSDF